MRNFSLADIVMRLHEVLDSVLGRLIVGIFRTLCRKSHSQREAFVSQCREMVSSTHSRKNLPLLKNTMGEITVEAGYPKSSRSAFLRDHSVLYTSRYFAKIYLNLIERQSMGLAFVCNYVSDQIKRFQELRNTNVEEDFDNFINIPPLDLIVSYALNHKRNPFSSDHAGFLYNIQSTLIPEDMWVASEEIEHLVSCSYLFFKYIETMQVQPRLQRKKMEADQYYQAVVAQFRAGRPIFPEVLSYLQFTWTKWSSEAEKIKLSNVYPSFSAWRYFLCMLFI